MRLTFITPGSVFLLDERTFPNLGVLKVAAACRARGHEVEHLDLDGVANYEEAAALHASQTVTDWFCITATTPQMPQVAKIVATLRMNSGAKVMLGGPHPTLTAAAVKLEQKRGVEGRAHRAMRQMQDIVDVVVAGDGEDAIEVAMRSSPGAVVDGDDPKGNLFLSKKRLEELPWPDRELVDLSTYHYKVDGEPATTLIAQLGCPFNCSFCGGRASPMLRRARQRSTESVLAEIEHLYRTYGYRGYMLYDDELNVSDKAMVALMRGIRDLQVKLGVPGQFRLRGFVKSELVTQEQADLMYEAGFRQLLCGFEAGHPRILENIQKKATVEQNTRCVEMAHKAGLTVKALMSIGHAGESQETVDAVRDWLLAVKPEDFDCTIITPYPGSPYYDEAVQGEAIIRRGEDARGPFEDTITGVWTYTSPITGDRLHAFELNYMETADYYKGDPNGGYRSYVFTDHMSPEDLVAARGRLETEVRAALNIPFNPGAAAIKFEHSMGQMGPLPPNILRRAS